MPAPSGTCYRLSRFSSRPSSSGWATPDGVPFASPSPYMARRGRFRTQPAPIGLLGMVPGYLPSAIAGHSGSSTARGRSSSWIGGGSALPFPFALPPVRRYARLSDFAEDRHHAHELYGQRHDDPPDRRAGGGVHTDPGVPAEPEP